MELNSVLSIGPPTEKAVSENGPVRRTFKLVELGRAICNHWLSSVHFGETYRFVATLCLVGRPLGRHPG